jgi:hypothetical protein
LYRYQVVRRKKEETRRDDGEGKSSLEFDVVGIEGLETVSQPFLSAK